MKNWVFDLDGTLVDSFGLYFKSMREIFADHGREFHSDLHLPALTEPLGDLFSLHLGSDRVNRAFDALQEKSNLDAPRIEPFAGIPELIDELIAKGAKIAVWTNRDLQSAELILKATGLKRKLEHCVSGTCVTRRKPDAEGLKGIIRRFDCSPSDVVMVGDHEHDVLGAQSAGATAVRASWHGYWSIEKCTQADFQFFTVPDFSAWARSV